MAFLGTGVLGFKGEGKEDGENTIASNQMQFVGSTIPVTRLIYLTFKNLRSRSPLLNGVSTYSKRVLDLGR
ncbi:hypothetical protein SDJN02_18125, partial [Cucurbita argyrosperma subsp. argyrosperma]